MPHFRDLTGGLHYLSDEDVANGGTALLPQGCVPCEDPVPETPHIPNPRRGQILAELAVLDARSVRPAREFATSSDSATLDAARARLVDLETQAQTLRDELAGLT